MKKKDRQARATEGRPITRKQYVIMMIGLGILLFALVIGFLIGRSLLANRFNTQASDHSSTPGTTTATEGIQDSSMLIPVPERPNGSLASLPDLAFTRGQTIHIGVSDPFGLINPLYATGDSDDDAVSLIFEPLLRLDQEGSPDLILADQIDVDPELSSVTFRLRKDHIWRDGRSVNATDVVFTYRCLMSPSYDGPLLGRFTDIETVKAGPVTNGYETVIFTFQQGVSKINYALLTVGILKSDYYAVPEDRVYEMGRKALPPEGSGAFQWQDTAHDRRILTCRDGFAGDIRTIVQILVGSDDKYPLLLSGELDIVRHDWNTRIEARTERLPGYAFFKSERTGLYLLTAPDRQKNGLPVNQADIHALLLAGVGQPSGRLAQAPELVLEYFAGIETVEAKMQADFALLVAGRLETAGQPVRIEALKLPELAEKAAQGDFQLLLLPVAADNRLPGLTVLSETHPDRPINATIVSRQSQIILISARLANLTINPYGAPFAAASSTYTDRLANVRILDKDGAFLIKEDT